MKPQIQIKFNIGNTISVPNLTDLKVTTYTGDNLLSGVTAIPSDNAVDFTSGSTILLLLSTIGQENCEIVQSASHTNTVFTTAATTMAHSRGEAISEIKYDQILIQKATSINGVYSTFTTQTFFTTQLATVIYDPTGLKTDYYKVQWRNSVSGLLSELSDPISVESNTATSAGTLIDSVLIAVGVDKNDKQITKEFMISALNDAREHTQAKLYGIRMAWREEFEHPERIYAGRNYVSLPSDIEFNETDRSVLAVRLLINNILAPYNFNYIDKRSWNSIAFNMMGSTTVGSTGIGSTTMVLSSTGDFPTGGGVAQVATTAFSQTIMSITYTANDLTTNTLSGVTGVTRIIPEGVQVWARPSLSQPLINYTVFQNKIVFSSAFPDSMQGLNLYIDYYKKFTPITALYDELGEPYREIYKSYLKYAIKYRKDIFLPSTDTDLKDFDKLVEALFNNLYSGQDSIIITN